MTKFKKARKLGKVCLKRLWIVSWEVFKISADVLYKAVVLMLLWEILAKQLNCKVLIFHNSLLIAITAELLFGTINTKVEKICNHFEMWLRKYVKNQSGWDGISVFLDFTTMFGIFLTTVFLVEYCWNNIVVDLLNGRVGEINFLYATFAVFILQNVFESLKTIDQDIGCW